MHFTNYYQVCVRLIHIPRTVFILVPTYENKWRKVPLLKADKKQNSVTKSAEIKKPKHVPLLMTMSTLPEDINRMFTGSYQNYSNGVDMQACTVYKTLSFD